MNSKTINEITKKETENSIYSLLKLFESYNYPTSEDVEIRVSNLRYGKNLRCENCISIIGKLLLCVGAQKVYIVNREPRIRDVWARCSCGRMILARYSYTKYFKPKAIQN